MEPYSIVFRKKRLQQKFRILFLNNIAWILSVTFTIGWFNSSSKIMLKFCDIDLWKTSDLAGLVLHD